MRWFKNLKIRSKLFITFTVLAIFSGIVGAVGIGAMKTINENGQMIYYEDFVPSQNLQIIRTALQEVRANQLWVVYERDPKTYPTRIETINQLIEQTNALLDDYETKLANDQDRKLFDALKNSLEEYRNARDASFQLIADQKYDEALADMATVTASRVKADEALNALIDFRMNKINDTLNQNEKSYTRETTIMLLFIAIGVVAALILGVYLSSMISGPINKMVRAAQQLAVGDVNAEVDAATKDEVGKLAEAFDIMIGSIRRQAQAVEKLATGDLTVEVEVRSEQDLLGIKLSELINKNNELLTNISMASDQVADGSKQISDASIALSSGATEQASAIEELTASLEEISSQTKQNAVNADQANDLTGEAKRNAVKGNEQMKEMLKAMEEINESSENISKIIKVIDDIAFQTNILALNAAVEAARAGQHGKGFAVVAEEVRNLAARSANAAKETTDMIESSIKKADGGTKIAKDTAEAFQTIVNRIEDIAGIVGNIALASNEQSLGIEQINQGIMQVSQVIQTNSATSQEEAAASEELYSQASILKEMVAQFKLRERRQRLSGSEEFSPEILALIDNRKLPSYIEKHPVAEQLTGRPKIKLNDTEFGKY